MQDESYVTMEIVYGTMRGKMTFLEKLALEMSFEERLRGS